MVPDKTQIIELHHYQEAHSHSAAAFSGSSSFAVPGHDDAVLHGLLQTALGNLRNRLRRALSSLGQDRKYLQSFTLHDSLGQALLRLHHVVNYDHSTVAQGGYVAEQ